MKKSLLLVFLSLCMIGLATGLMACNKHEHSCTTWLSEKEVTCTEDGEKTGICDGCGEQFTVITPALGHDWEDWEIIEQPDCQNVGHKDRDCKRCHTVEVQDIATTDHDYGQWQVREEATCVKTGESYRRCNTCQHEETKVIDMIDHNFDENGWQTDIEATCTRQGTEINVCTICQKETKTRLTEKLPHQKEVYQGQPATCDQDGWTDGEICKVCQTVLKPREVIAAQGHNWGQWSPAEEKGKHKRECETCNTVDTQECIYANRVTVEATCLEDGYVVDTCQECGDKFEVSHTDALGHKYGSWTPIIVENEEQEGHVHKHYRECTRCYNQAEHDKDFRQEEECNLQEEGRFDVTCTTNGYIKQVCSDCGGVHEITTEKATGHNLVYEKPKGLSILAYQHRQKCQNPNCDYVTEYQDCKLYTEVVPASCGKNKTTKYICSICQQECRTIPTEGSALEHKMSPWTHCGTKDNPQHTQFCENGCGYRVTEPCEMERTETLPTCTQGGKVEQTCKKCFTTYTEDGKVSSGHQWGKWTADAKTGQHKQTCSACGQTNYENHNYNDTIIQATCTEPERTIRICTDCQDRQEIISGERPLGHAWQVTSITKESHTATCAKCNEERTGLAHDWTESNLCSVCKYDGLEYELEGVHCYVIKDDKVANAKVIEIPAQHKVLLDNGEYDTTQYTVKGIKEQAFINSKGVTKLILPATVEFIGDNAFLNCKNLVSIELDVENSALTSIGELAFSSCWALKSFNAPKSLQKIGGHAFFNCVGLENIVITDNVLQIGTNAFSDTAYVSNSKHWNAEVLYLGKHLIKARHHELEDGTYSNKEIVIANGTLTVATNAFSECANLEKITIPNTVTIIDKDAFLNCKNLTQVEFTGDLHEWLAIDFVNDYSSPLCYGETGLHIAKAHDSIDLTQSPRPITKIPAGTFKNTDIQSIKFSNTVKYIGEEAFMNCKKLKTIEFEEGCKFTYVGVDAFTGSAYYLDEENNWTDGVLYVGTALIKAKSTLADHYDVRDGTTTIADYAFEDCNLLKSVNIDYDVERVGAQAFKGCSSMQTLTFENTEWIWLVTGSKVVSRGFGHERLNWNNLKAYDGGWTRSYKAA